MMDHRQQILEKILSRIDSLIESTNTKGNFIIAFNSFIFTAIIIGYAQIFTSFKHNNVIIFSILLHFLLFAIAFSCSMSIIIALNGLKPFLKTGNKEKKYRSLLFFGSIQELDLKNYKSAIETLTEEGIKDDFIQQCHLLSGALQKKFNNISKSIFWIYILIITILCLVVLKIFDFLIP